MVWGKAASSGNDDLVKRISSNDPKLASLTIMAHRRFTHEVGL